MKNEEYSFLQKLNPIEVKDKLRPFITQGREIFERGDYALVFIDTKEKVYALHSALFDDEEYYHDWWVTVDVLSFYYAHYPELVKGSWDSISALKLKNLDDCYVAVPSQFNERDWEVTYSYNRSKGHYTLVLVNRKSKEHINLFSSIHTTAQIAIDEAYKWFRERELDITDLSNWLVEDK